MKTFKVLLFLACFGLNYYSVTAQADFINEETSAPYGFLDMGFFVNNIRYEGYTIAANEVDIVRSGFGGGLEGHFPLIYLFAHKNKHRFRIADDIVIGASLNPGIEGGSKSTRAGFSAVYGLGLQSVYRINKTFDVGLKYYPVFFRGDAQMGHTYGTAFAFHARVARFYVDYRIIPEVLESHLESTGINLLSVKYLYTPISSKNSYYVSLSFGWDRYYRMGYANGVNFVSPFKWNTIQLNWGIYF